MRVAAAAAIVTVSLLAAWPVRSVASATAPKEIVETTARTALDILNNGEMPSTDKIAKLEALFLSTVDYPTVTRLVLGRNWRTLSEAQFDAFSNEFKRHLSTTYGRNLDNYTKLEIEVVGEREEPRGDRTIKTKINRPNAEAILVDYRMREREAEWKIIDVIIEGVSMVSNFRSQFQEVISNGGPDRLIELLKEKNEASIETSQS
jgi:phospholipid transport system substrate-binding protein